VEDPPTQRPSRSAPDAGRRHLDPDQAAALRVGGKLYSEVTDPWAEDIGDGDDRIDC
jgi:hypothetical protein